MTHAYERAGARRAAGINYAAIGGAARLRARGDVRWAHARIRRPRGFRVLVDDGRPGQPTDETSCAPSVATPGDALFFHFSGRAILPRDEETNARNNADIRTSPDAAPTSPGWRQAIAPTVVVFVRSRTAASGGARAVRRRRRRSHHRGDLRAALVDPLPRGVRLTVVLDCPEGGAGAVDLPFAFEARDAGDDFGAGSSGVETADPLEVGRTIVVATRANATTVETWRRREGSPRVSMFASIDDEKSSARVETDRVEKEGGRREEERRVRGGRRRGG